MQSSDFDPDLYKKWFRRPTIFVGVAWMLLCAAAKVALPKLALPLSSYFALFGLPHSKYALTLALDALYKIGILLVPAAIYACVGLRGLCAREDERE